MYVVISPETGDMRRFDEEDDPKARLLGERHPVERIPERGPPTDIDQHLVRQAR